MNAVTNVRKRATVALVKTDIERGPWGAWAYHTRDDNFPELTPEQVSVALGYSDSTIRKVEAGSPGHNPPSKPIRRKLPKYYAALAREHGITIDPPPPDPDAAPAEPPTPAPTFDPALAEAIFAMVEEVRLSRVAQETIALALGELTSHVDALLARQDMRVGPGRGDGDGSHQGTNP